MLSLRLQRAGGLALLLGGVLLGLAVLLHPDEANPAAVLAAIWGPVHITMLVAAVLSVFGLLSACARAATRAGVAGLVGFALLIIGTVLLAPILVIEALVVPALAADAAGAVLLSDTGPLFGGALGLYFMCTALVFSLGCLIGAIAIVRSGALPRLAGVLLVGGALLAFNPPLPHLAGTIGGLLLSLGYAWLGYAVFAGRAAPALAGAARPTV
jgi:hypothetical protein